VKASVEDLAVFGGAPAFSAPLYVGRPNIGDRTKLHQRIDEILDRRWLTNGGRFVDEFEHALANRLGVRHCIAMANGTIALEIAIRACALVGEVIVPAFTFVATAHALQWQGITPVFCEVDPRTHNIDPERAAALIGPRTTAIMAVHLWGRPAPVRELAGISSRHGLRLLFDASHALGSSAGGRAVGGFGDAEVLSFHATKFVNTFEGGAIVTNNDALAARARAMKNFGFHDYDDVRSIGTNGKMSEVAAAMGITSLEAMAGFVEVNRRNYMAYRRALLDLPGIRLLDYDETQPCNYQYVVLEIDGEAGLTRDQLVRILVAEGVIARRYFYPGCHRMEPYRTLYPAATDRLPVTDRVASRVLQLPTGTAVDEERITMIADIVRLSVERAGEIGRRLGQVQAHEVYAGL
jgi:dTDP-4-amino-4,6-dideoxygalactose transaminase